MLSEINNFINTNKILCIATLGLAIVGFLGYRTVKWLKDSCCKSKIIQNVADNILKQPSQKIDNTPFTAAQTPSNNSSAAINSVAMQRPPLTQNEKFQQWKDKLLRDLPAKIISERINPSYVRKDLPELKDALRNCRVPLDQLSKPAEISHQVNQGVYYPFNAEGVADIGWGCAWRSTQICLSRYLGQNTPSFEEAFHLFGPVDNLEELYKNLYGKELPAKYVGRYYAPYIDKYGWAEPLVTHLALHFYGIKSDLHLLHCLPENSSSSVKVFKHPPIDFTHFVERIQKHFNNPSPAPIMIDDGHRAMTIIGYGIEGDHIHLRIADPHINAGVSTSPQDSPGIFMVTLDSTGKRIAHSCDAAQTALLLKSEVYPGISFESGFPWTALFPGS